MRFDEAALRFALGLAGPLDWDSAQKWGPYVGRLLRRIAVERFRIAVENLRAAGMPDPVRIADRMFDHLGTMILEILAIRRMARGEIVPRLIQYRGREHYETARSRGRGVLLSLGHFGNWEVTAPAYRRNFGRLHAVYRPLDNAVLDRLVFEMRTGYGQTMIPMAEATVRVAAALRAGETVAILADQDARRHGIFVDFFGRPASTLPSLAILSLRTGAPILPVHPVREEGRFLVEADAPIFPEAMAGEDRIRRMTQEVVRRLEAAVRRRPEQYFWLHRRWKTRP
jgi:KDO2-lipid IV(A) lauroyltransferase